MKIIIRIIVWVIATPVMAYGMLLTGVTLLASMVGTPREPPPGMSDEEFHVWVESGRWFWEAILTGGMCLFVPMSIAVGVTLATRKHQRLPNESASKS